MLRCPFMVAPEPPRRPDLASDGLRRFIRRGARPKIVRLLARTRPEDVAELFGRLTPSEQLAIYRILVTEFPDGAGEVLSELDEPDQQALLEGMTRREIGQVLGAMPVDDAVEIVESLPDQLEERVLEVVGEPQLAEVREHLTYDDESAGRLMVPAFVALPETATVEQAIAELRSSDQLDNIFYLYVVDAEGVLVGVASLRQLLLAPPGRRLGEVMTREVVRVRVDTDQEVVAELVARYDLLAIPVTDAADRLVGIVTVDDVIDVVSDEATEDFYKLVGTSDDELIYQDRAVRVAGLRLPWLLGNMVGGVLAGMLLEWFQVSFKEALFLLTFVPVIMGMGGNVGSQTSTIAVRGLATGRIPVGRRRTGRFLWQQLKVGMVIGVTCSLLVGGGAFLIQRNPYYALVVGGALLAAIVVASLNGALIPILFRRLGIDPAVASGPLVTTTNDITGILIYFGLAALLIDRLVR